MQLFENLESEDAKKKKKNIEKIAFKVVQIKFLIMHITNQKLHFGIFTVGNLLNIFMEHFWHKIKIYNFDPCNVFLAIATDIPQRFKTVSFWSRVTNVLSLKFKM